MIKKSILIGKLLDLSTGLRGNLRMYSMNVVPTRQNSLVVIFDNFRIGLSILIHRKEAELEIDSSYQAIKAHFAISWKSAFETTRMSPWLGK